MKEQATRQETQIPQPGKDHISAEFNDFLVSKQIFDKTTTVYEVAILAYLYKYAFSSQGIFPGFNTIARNIHCCRNTVIATLKRLTEKGLITKTFRGETASGEFSSNLYSLTLGGSARDALPSARDALPSARDALPSARDAPERGVGGKVKLDKVNLLNDKKVLPINKNCNHYWVKEDEGYRCLTCEEYKAADKAPEPARLRKVTTGDPDLIPLDHLRPRLGKSAGEVLAKI